MHRMGDETSRGELRAAQAGARPLSLPALWAIYKRLLSSDCFTTHDRILAHSAFYAGARVTLRMLAQMIEHGDYELLHKTIERQGRRMKALHGLKPRRRRH